GRTRGAPVHQDPRVGEARGRRRDRRHHRARPGRARRRRLYRVARKGSHVRGGQRLRHRRVGQGGLGPVRAGWRRDRRGQRGVERCSGEDKRGALWGWLDHTHPRFGGGGPPIGRGLREASGGGRV
ncbi:MAG: Glycine cleavage system H protein, partial [uncultured Rubrobacteraceae bacterium]